MIKYLVSKDNLYKLRKEKNVFNKIPLELEKAKNFLTWLYTIWDAAAEGNLGNQIQYYIKSKAYDVNQKRPGDLKTPLHIAVQNNKVDIARLLLSLGADPNIEDAQKKQPIHYLSLKNETAVKNIKRMLNRKASRANWNIELEGQNLTEDSPLSP